MQKLHLLLFEMHPTEICFMFWCFLCRLSYSAEISQGCQKAWKSWTEPWCDL